jgi:hypothetical protein
VIAMRFKAELQSANEAGRWVQVPESVASSFSSKRPPVRATVNGVSFRSRLSVYGGKSYLGFTAAVRKAAGISLGDVLDISVEVDDEPREVELPSALTVALEANPDAAAVFSGLAFTHRKEYETWIAEAKRDETRERRVVKAIEMLTAGTKTPR